MQLKIFYLYWAFANENHILETCSYLIAVSKLSGSGNIQPAANLTVEFIWILWGGCKTRKCLSFKEDALNDMCGGKGQNNMCRIYTQLSVCR